MTSRPIHAARPGLSGNHRTDAIPCRCDPWRLVDLNEPGREVLVHRSFDEDADTRATGDRETEAGDNRPDAEAMGRYAPPCIADQQAPETDRERQSGALGTGAVQRVSTLGLLGGRPPGGTHTRQMALIKTAPALRVHAYDFAAFVSPTATRLCAPTMHSLREVG